LIASDPSAPNWMTLTPDNVLYWLNNGNQNIPSDLRSVSLSGGTNQTLLSNLHGDAAGVAVDPADHNKLYVGNFTTLLHVARDGMIWPFSTHTRTHVYGLGTSVKTILDLGRKAFLHGVAVDTLRGKLYFNNFPQTRDAPFPGGMFKCNLDGTRIERLTSEVGVGIEVDRAAKFLYYTVDGAIKRMELDTLETAVVSKVPGFPYGIALYYGN